MCRPRPTQPTFKQLPPKVDPLRPGACALWEELATLDQPGIADTVCQDRGSRSHTGLPGKKKGDPLGGRPLNPTQSGPRLWDIAEVGPVLPDLTHHGVDRLIEHGVQRIGLLAPEGLLQHLGRSLKTGCE